MMKCQICLTNNSVKHWFEKKGYDYNYCTSCKSLFTLEPLPNDNMIGGGNEEERNERQNKERIRRILEINPKPFVLDYGCGHGMLVYDLLQSKVNAIGFDKYNEDFYFLPKMKVDIVTLVEVIEHTSHPFAELDIIHSMLKDDGVLYIETSFTDIAENLNINLKDFFYVEPTVGHSTIFSHKGLTELMKRKGFEPLQHINDNVRLYKKINHDLN